MGFHHSNSQIKPCHYTLLYSDYGSIWFYMCSTVQSPQAVLNGVINLLSNTCYQKSSHIYNFIVDTLLLSYSGSGKPILAKKLENL